MDAEFFARYDKEVKKAVGIPGMKMNKPLVVSNYPTDIGLELEIEAGRGSALPRDHHLDVVRSKKSHTSWRSVNDGSLRGEAREYILNQPCYVDEIPELVNGLFNVMQTQGAVIQNSNRCSTHVHINMGNKTVNIITSVICLWGVFEQALIDYNGEERQSNHFCLSFKDSSSVLDAWNHFLRFGRSPGERAGNIKYSALNILTLWQKGSLEFRCGKPSDEPTFPIKWATFVYKLARYAETKYPNPAMIGYELSEQGAYKILVDICQGTDVLSGFAQEVLGDKDQAIFNGECLEGFRRVQSLAYGVPWELWMPHITKAYVPNPFDNGRMKEEAVRPARFAVPMDEPALRPMAGRIEPNIHNGIPIRRRVVNVEPMPDNVVENQIQRENFEALAQRILGRDEEGRRRQDEEAWRVIVERD